MSIIRIFAIRIITIIIKNLPIMRKAFLLLSLCLCIMPIKVNAKTELLTVNSCHTMWSPVKPTENWFYINYKEDELIYVLDYPIDTRVVIAETGITIPEREDIPDVIDYIPHHFLEGR